MYNKSGIQKVVIAGGGTAGWMAAAALAKLIGKNIDIKLVESDEISTVGVGEATIPPLKTFHQLLKINEAEFMRFTQATFKLGINFENWKDKETEYFHSFGTTGKDCWAATFQHFWLRGRREGFEADYGEYCLELQAAKNKKFAHLKDNSLNYAYHLDAGLYAKFLRNIAEQHGVRRIEGKIHKVKLSNDSGYIESLLLADGQSIEGDLFIDCTGFRGLLIEQALHTGYENWSHWLPCDSAIAVQTEAEEAPLPYTRSVARDSGWQWKIPLQKRCGNGIVYCSRYQSNESAEEELLRNVSGKLLTEPKTIKFTTGVRRKQWNKNCVALGLSSGFIEPLESTSIHLIQRGIIRLIQLFPTAKIEQANIDEFNEQARIETEFVRDFIILHYKVTERKDSAFWQYCKNMEVPESLQRKIDLFSDSGCVFKEPWDLFAENSWIQVMLGQGITPKTYHPIADMMSEQEQTLFLNGIRASVRKTVEMLPIHAQYLKQYCPSS
ncbi:tryptophan halogenase family protein [Catenovulum sediminis]|uniref:Tryptophan halogenase family protein n=1 Tax=Catenovulum sediminis TaxID=1740262 RepID=A0ABV1RLQ9_9ALTE|nr:tryptophan halogenase family protein [Catenovulum sediminis]